MPEMEGRAEVLEGLVAVEREGSSSGTSGVVEVVARRVTMWGGEARVVGVRGAEGSG